MYFRILPLFIVYDDRSGGKNAYAMHDSCGMNGYESVEYELKQ